MGILYARLAGDVAASPVSVSLRSILPRNYSFYTVLVIDGFQDNSILFYLVREGGGFF